MHKYNYMHQHQHIMFWGLDATRYFPVPSSPVSGSSIYANRCLNVNQWEFWFTSPATKPMNLRQRDISIPQVQSTRNSGWNVAQLKRGDDGLDEEVDDVYPFFFLMVVFFLMLVLEILRNMIRAEMWDSYLVGSLGTSPQLLQCRSFLAEARNKKTKLKRHVAWRWKGVKTSYR